MNIEKTALSGVLVLEPKVFGDHRGWFCETYNLQRLQDNGINALFVQDNHSLSTQKGTLRGLHFQNNPKAQTKLIWCTSGRILDVVVDLRKGSSTYLKWISAELSAENHKQLLIPKGFAHGFITLTENTEVEYKVDEYYDPDCDRSIRFDDPDIAVDWGEIKPILSAKDQNAPFLHDCDCNFAIDLLIK